MDFSFDSKNTLLLNPRLAESEKNILQELAGAFEKAFGNKNYFLIASSGSSRQSFESVKLVALAKTAVLNSAKRFNSYFNASAEDNWGMLLPQFHVAGLGILARAHLSGAKVVAAEWPVPQLTGWIEHNQIKMMSMVPAQIYDLVKNQIWAPPGFKSIFVGAGALNNLLKEQVEKLGWNLVETYGMTETASMVAVKVGEDYKLMPGVQARIEEDLLCLLCDSLLSASVQKVNDSIELKKFDSRDWFQTQDCAEIRNHKLRLLGRKSEYVKILGEGVSLSELKSVLEKAVLQAHLHPREFELVALEDERAGAELFLVVQNNVLNSAVEFVLKQYNNSCRPYEKIGEVIRLDLMPRTALGKLKVDELKTIIKESRDKGAYGES